MPQARKENTQAQRALDKESKRARGALSCAECRRLKLKCDKTVPCSSCKRRGCSEICPNGSLTTGQGTRFVLADTETLHQKIGLMSDRIRQLEDALAILQSTLYGTEPHALLQGDFMKIKSSLELHSASGLSNTGEKPSIREEEGDSEIADTFGTLAIREDGAATFYGRSAGSESLLIDESSITPPYDDDDASPQLSSSLSYANMHNSSVYLQPDNLSRQPFSTSDGRDIPQTIAVLAAAFPLAPSISYTPSSGPLSAISPLSFVTSPSVTSLDRITLQDLVSNYLPPYAEAVRLTQLYLEQAPWFFGAVTRRQVEEEMLPLWYEEAAVNASSTPPGGLVTSSSSAVGSPHGSLGKQERARSSHDLALLFVIFCFGALTDTNEPSPPDNAPAEKFYQLTKAALSLDPAAPSDSPKPSRNGVLERPPSVATVQTLSLMAIYEGMCSGENSIESTWALMGLSCKLAQSIGLHRDCARWGLTPAEVQKRRGLFWELFITDCWQSLATGRLATFSLPFVDCELPADPDQTMADDGTVQPSFPYWKARFGAECVSAVVQGTLTSRAPKYSIILDLDRKVRDMQLPQYAQGSPPQGVGLAQTMSHFMPQNYRELTLLYIHRCFFAHALTSSPLDPLKSQYAPSFLAGYRSACTIITSVKAQFNMFPAQIARFWVLWTHAFSGAVMLASVTIHSPSSKIAKAAMVEFKNACDLFEAASKFGGRAVKFLPVLKRLQSKAQKSFRDSNDGLPPSNPKDIFKPSKSSDRKDELSIFSGKTHTVSTKSTPPLASSSQSNPSNSISLSDRSSSKSSPRSSSDSPQQMFTDNPSFAGVHPSLVSELHTFQGHIRASIQTAYRSGEELFTGAPMAVDSSPTSGPSPGTSNFSMQSHHHPQHSNPQVSHQHHMLQQQQQQQHDVYQQHEALERHRAEVEGKERQELERQHMEHQLRQQETEGHQHQREIQRQQHLQHHVPTYHQQERQQHRHEHRQEHSSPQEQQMGHYRQTYDVEPVQFTYGPAHATSAPPSHAVVPSSHPQRRPSQPQLQQGSQQPYQHPPPQHYAPPSHHSGQNPQTTTSHTHSASHAYVSQHSNPQQTGPPEPHTYHQVAPQQHSMYTIPPDYQHHPSPDSVHTSSSSLNYVPLPPSSYSQPPSATTSTYEQDTYTYWPAASHSFAMPDQQPTTMSYGAVAGPSHHHQQYTPDGALRGIAAEDRGLQETWQSYMSNVASPRQYLED